MPTGYDVIVHGGVDGDEIAVFGPRDAGLIVKFVADCVARGFTCEVVATYN